MCTDNGSMAQIINIPACSRTAPELSGIDQMITSYELKAKRD
jgi:hypothetical protein